MKNVIGYFLLFIKKCKSKLCNRFVYSEASEADMQMFFEESRHQLLEMRREEAEFAEWLAECQEEDRRMNDETAYRECMDQLGQDQLDEMVDEQKYYQSNCPWCGSLRSGRCKPCDRAFGRD